ncbi:hypothetical protein N0V95_009248 [Ascochyta clinopodiicola]|nr:hypothetical protein N0V95_009248 [Ascochyta clinopodiicola]
MAPARDNEFLPEVWALYSLGALWIVLRFAVRLRTNGIRGLRLDDGFAFVALFAWTFTCAAIQITYYTGTNTDFSAAEIALFDRAKFEEVVYGSKLFLGTCCVNAITDIFLLSVPISLLWNLNKPLRTRFAVFILLASGLFVLAAWYTNPHLTALHHLTTSSIIRVSLTVVPNIFVLNIARWGVREFCIAIVAVNTASLRPPVN